MKFETHVPFSRNSDWYPFRGVENRMPNQFSTPEAVQSPIADEEPIKLYIDEPAIFPYATGQPIKETR